MNTRYQQKIILGRHFDALAHRHTMRSLPRQTCSAEESGRGPTRWWHDGDRVIGIAAWFGVAWLCLEIIRGVAQ